MTIKLDSRSLSFLICDSLRIQHGTPEFKFVFDASVEYICVNTNIKMFHNKLASVVDFKELEISAPQFRMMLTESGYVVANIKFFTTFACLGRPSRFDMDELRYRYQICACDSDAVYEALAQLRRSVKEHVHKQGNNRKQYSPAAFDKVKNTFVDMMPDLEKHIRIVTAKKLTFIRKSFNMTRDEFWSELMIQALRAYYKSVPNDHTTLHQLNYLRATINNRAVNMIESYVSQKRQRLINVGSDNGAGAKFVLNMVAESQLPTNSEGELQIADAVDEADILSSERNDFSISISRLLSRYGKTKRGFILTVFCGYEVPVFSDWLRKKRILRSEDKNSQDVMASRSIGECYALVSEFTDIPVKLIKQTLGEMANELGIINTR